MTRLFANSHEKYCQKVLCRRQNGENFILSLLWPESKRRKTPVGQNKGDMDNIKVMLFVESRYKVNRKRITAIIKNLLSEQMVTGLVEVSVAIIGDRKMRDLNKKYRDKDETTNVLSFSLNEDNQTDILRLGDIVISYPEVIREAAEEEVLVDDKIDELVKHGLSHLLGIHH